MDGPREGYKHLHDELERDELEGGDAMPRHHLALRQRQPRLRQPAAEDVRARRVRALGAKLLYGRTALLLVGLVDKHEWLPPFDGRVHLAWRAASGVEGGTHVVWGQHQRRCCSREEGAQRGRGEARVRAGGSAACIGWWVCGTEERRC